MDSIDTPYPKFGKKIGMDWIYTSEGVWFLQQDQNNRKIIKSKITERGIKSFKEDEYYPRCKLTH